MKLDDVKEQIDRYFNNISDEDFLKVANEYKLIEDDTYIMSLKTKLEQEKRELDEKVERLNNFLMSDKVNQIEDVQRALLHVQSIAMNTYSQCLLERITRL